MQIREYTGDRGAALRNGLLGAEAYQIRDFVERLANVSYRAAALSYHKVGNLLDPEKALLIEYGFRAPNFGRVTGKDMLIDQPLPLLRLGGSLASLEARKTPQQTNRELNMSFRCVLKLPPGANVETILSPLELETDFGLYHVRFSEKQGSVYIDRNFHLKAQRISPEDYPRFVEFCRAIDATERREIIVRLGP
jgi:hypothetical protein